MAERRWTVLVVPHGVGASLAVEVSQAVVKTLVGMTTVFVALLVLLGSAIVWRGVNISRARELAQENEVLATQLSEIEQRLTTLSDTLALMTQRDEQVRLAAGLPPTDPEMQQAGIGGPSAEWAARDQLAGVVRAAGSWGFRFHQLGLRKPSYRRRSREPGAAGAVGRQGADRKR